MKRVKRQETKTLFLILEPYDNIKEQSSLISSKHSSLILFIFDEAPWLIVAEPNNVPLIPSPLYTLIVAVEGPYGYIGLVIIQLTYANLPVTPDVIDCH